MQKNRKLNILQIIIVIIAIVGLPKIELSFEQVIIVLIISFVGLLIHNPPEPLYQLLQAQVDIITHRQRFNFNGIEFVLDKSIQISSILLEEMIRNALREAD